MDYLIQQKLIIMDVTEVDEHNTLHADQLVQIPDAKRMRRLLLLPLEDNDGQITPSKLAQKHICAPTDGKYTVVKALELFRSSLVPRLSPQKRGGESLVTSAGKAVDFRASSFM